MSHLIKLFQRFSKDESGAALVEYAVIFAILLAGTITAMAGLSTEIGNLFADVVGVLQAIIALPN